MLEHDWFDRPLPSNLRIGEGSWLYSSFAFGHCRAGREDALHIGRHSGIYDGSFFDLGPDARVSIGDYTTLVGAILCSNGVIRIGSYVFMAHEVVLADHPYVVPGIGPVGAPTVVSEAEGCIVVEDNVWIGARAVLLAGARIGENAVVGAGAVVDFEVPPGALVAGNPARILRRFGVPA